MKQGKLKMMIVGAFPDRKVQGHGGILTVCRILMESSLPRRVKLTLIDSSLTKLPPPTFVIRVARAGFRFIKVHYNYTFNRPDIVLFFASPGGSFIEKSILAVGARVFGIKVLMSPRGAKLITDYNNSRQYAWLLRILFSVPNKMICQGAVYQDFFVDKVGMDEKRCSVISNWTATHSLLEIGENRCKVASECISILFMGWIDKEKGVFELLEAIKAIVSCSDKRSIKLLMAGEGNALDEIRNYVVANELQKYVELLGWINEKQKIKYLKEAHILILPSYMEGMPNVVIEAMASGLPVIATNVGVVGEMIKTGKNGIVIEPRNSEEIVLALDQLLNNADLRYRLGKAAWKDACEKYNTELAMDSLVKIAHELVNE